MSSWSPEPGRRFPQVRLLLALTTLAGVLALAALWRYPAPQTLYLFGALLGLALLVGLGLWLWQQATRPLSPSAALARQWGMACGAVGGLLWVLEIAFNNFVSARSPATDLARLAQTRDRVDDLFWVLVVFSLLWGSLNAARRTLRWRSGLAAGGWGGLVSGLCACVMAQLMVVVWMPLLANDPLNVIEFGQRGPLVSGSGLTTYLAYQTLAGAYLHLLVLGVLMGLGLGVVGGGIGMLFSRSGRRDRQRP